MDGPCPEIPGYELGDELGRGTSGVVYAATQVAGLRLPVAIKVIHPGLLYTEFDNRFALERAALARLRHPGIAQVLEGGTTATGVPYLVMERIEGDPIDVWCEARRPDLATRLELVAQVADAVQAAHRQGIVHRDLKPANILVSGPVDDPRPKVIDFGLAKLLEPLDEDPLDTALGTRLGTPVYMAPEQLGLGDALDSRADVFGLGAVLFCVLTGRHPLDPDELRSLPEPEQLERLARVARPQPSTVVEDPALRRRLRGDLDLICARALALEPDERYPDANALAADLRLHLADQPIRARPASLGYVLAKAARRHRLATMAGAAALLLLLALLVGLVQANRQARQAEELARAEARDARALAGFLLGHFSGEDLADDDPLAREELERAEAQLREREATLSSRARAQARQRLGLAWQQLGELDRARALLAAASGALGPAAASDSLLLLELCLQRATLAARQARLAEADSLARIVLLRTPAWARTQVGTHLAHAARGEAAQHAGDFGAAIAHYRAGLEDLSTAGRGPRAQARLRRMLGNCLNRIGRFGEARVELEAALALLEDTSDAPAGERIGVLHNLAVSLCGLQRHAEAIPMLEEVAAYQRSAPGAQGKLGRTLNDLANAIWESASTAADTTQALLHYLDALRAKRAALGERHPALFSTLCSIGDVKRARGQLQEAVATYEEAAGLILERHGPDHPSLSTSSFNLGLAYEDMGDTAGALRAFRNAARVDSLALGPEHPYYLEGRAKIDALVQSGGEER